MNDTVINIVKMALGIPIVRNHSDYWISKKAVTFANAPRPRVIKSIAPFLYNQHLQHK